MCSDGQTQDRHVMEVPTCYDLPRYGSQLALALFTVTGPMDQDLIRCVHHGPRALLALWCSTDGFFRACEAITG
jgi:hypothetical protein